MAILSQQTEMYSQHTFNFTLQTTHLPGLRSLTYLNCSLLNRRQTSSLKFSLTFLGFIVWRSTICRKLIGIFCRRFQNKSPNKNINFATVFRMKLEIHSNSVMCLGSVELKQFKLNFIKQYLVKCYRNIKKDCYSRVFKHCTWHRNSGLTIRMNRTSHAYAFCVVLWNFNGLYILFLVIGNCCVCVWCHMCASLGLH